jgi:cell division protein FtsW
MAVVSGSVPATGIPLPFFSAGGSSLATTLVSAGFIVNVCRRSSVREHESGAYGGGNYNEAEHLSGREDQDVR